MISWGTDVEKVSSCTSNLSNVLSNGPWEWAAILYSDESCYGTDNSWFMGTAGLCQGHLRERWLNSNWLENRDFFVFWDGSCSWHSFPERDCIFCVIWNNILLYACQPILMIWLRQSWFSQWDFSVLLPIECMFCWVLKSVVFQRWGGLDFSTWEKVRVILFRQIKQTVTKQTDNLLISLPHFWETSVLKL